MPNEVEAAAICNRPYPTFDIDESLQMAHDIMLSGVDQVVVTLSDYGLAYAVDDESGYIPARYSNFIDSTGTGDAIAAAVIFGILNQLPAIECMRLGAAAASLTLQTGESVVKELSLDLLYDNLTV